MEEAKITSVEKVKDPKIVEAGKRLAAMSKQAKEKKAIEKLSQKMSVNEFQIPTCLPLVGSVEPLAVLGIVGVVGVVVYYKYFNKSEPVNSVETAESKTIDIPKEEEKPKPKRRELDTLD